MDEDGMTDEELEALEAEIERDMVTVAAAQRALAEKIRRKFAEEARRRGGGEVREFRPRPSGWSQGDD